MGKSKGKGKGRILAIGDIHGCLAALELLAEEVGFSAEDTVVTLGDYVDRGPDSKGVLDFLMELEERCELVSLRGNHEVMMVRSRSAEGYCKQWCTVGGAETLESYGGSFDGVPEEHWNFIDQLLPSYETKRHLFVHANLDPERPLDDQTDEMIYWERFGFPEPHISGKTMICGHTAQRSGDIADLGNAVCIDTRAHGNGWLTCLDVKSGTYWQANQAGDLRERTRKQ